MADDPDSKKQREMHRLARRAVLEGTSRQLRDFAASAASFRAWPAGGLKTEADAREKGLVSTVVVLDSSFNPPTRAHLRMARSGVLAARGSSGGAAAVDLLLLLAVNNADKAAKPAAFPVRLAMMEAFARDLLAEMEASGKEHERGGRLGVSLGLTTLPYFHDKCRAVAESGYYTVPGDGASVGPEQIYLAGFDTLIRIFNSKYYAAASGDEGVQTPMQTALDPFFRRARLRITMRTDDSWGGREEQFGYVEGLRRGKLDVVGGRATWMERVELVEGRPEGEVVVSSSAVREAVRTGRMEKLEEMLSPEVRQWVVEEGLYVEES